MSEIRSSRSDGLAWTEVAIPRDLAYYWQNKGRAEYSSPPLALVAFDPASAVNLSASNDCPAIIVAVEFKIVRKTQADERLRWLP